MENAEVRIAKTESLFRDVNERIAESAQRFDSDEATFVCECADPECTERLEAPLHTYEEVREDGTQFLLAPGHEDERVESVVERRRRFNVVRKVNRIVVAHVRRLDPRSASS
ncbi:MAG: hypothetical protein E6G42_00440 [Actinobacteria bacterium]|nr:MAG: hypothetical protein E6G42_00440 [Actinomycetota bacterium]